MMAFFDDNFTLPCDCTDFPIVNKGDNHIITDNLKLFVTISCANFSLNVQSTEKTKLLTIKKIKKA